MFGLKHSGLQGQRLTDAVTWIHQRMGLETSEQRQYCSLNYSDDIGGCERDHDRAIESFEALGSLFKELGLIEAETKAHPPSTCMPYLGVVFDTLAMTISIPGEKIEELREELSQWLRRKKASKRNLQRLLGKLFWVSRCVKFSRGFMARLLAQLRALTDMPDHKTRPLPSECIEDIKWWHRYVRRFNGVELLYPEEPLSLPLEELQGFGAFVYCGDAQPAGGGGFFGDEYWSREFPSWLSDTNIPIHIKEFWVLVASAALWGDKWRGSLVYCFCDNAAVVHVLDKERPKDTAMASILREFLYLVCTRNFTPVFRHIGTKKNMVADYLSRVHDQSLLDTFLRHNMPKLVKRKDIPDVFFTPSAMW